MFVQCSFENIMRRSFYYHLGFVEDEKESEMATPFLNDFQSTIQTKLSPLGWIQFIDYGHIHNALVCL